MGTGLDVNVDDFVACGQHGHPRLTVDEEMSLSYGGSDGDACVVELRAS